MNKIKQALLNISDFLLTGFDSEVDGDTLYYEGAPANAQKKVKGGNIVTRLYNRIKSFMFDSDDEDVRLIKRHVSAFAAAVVITGITLLVTHFFVPVTA